MIKDYGMMELSNVGPNDEDRNGIRQTFGSFDDSRQKEQSVQYGHNNQYDCDSNDYQYQTFFEGDEDGE